MKRKIAAIVAADIAGYSRLISADEEDTLRRLKRHREVYDGLVEQYGGRIFNTAGDAVLSEFPSSVDAVRCAIEIQESLRRLNRAYQPSRHMNFRIGISLGDVVERDGDLLGDGVNIAARLEGLAEPGGICIARSVHEQVAAKLSVAFTDIGPQMVKNIPQPVHAFTLSLGGEPASAAPAKPAEPPAPRPAPSQPKSSALTATAGGGLGNGARLAALGLLLVASACGFYAISWQRARPAAEPQVVSDALPDETLSPSVVDLPSVIRTDTTLEPEKIPYISNAQQEIVANVYLPAKDSKALALSRYGAMGMSTDKPTETAATAAALESCQVTAAKNPCTLFAIGNRVVSKSGPPPMPPTPWVNSDERMHQPFDAMKLPFMPQATKERLRDAYAKVKPPMAVAISSAGNYQIFSEQKSTAEAVRRALEVCGARIGVACRIAALDDKLVLPIPETHKPTGFLDAWTAPEIAAEARPLLAAKIAISRTGWSAIAVGSNAIPGLATGGETEDAAVAQALATCGRLTSACRIIAIGPFTVAPD